MLAPIEIERTSRAVENIVGPLGPRPDEKSARFTPKSTTWNDMMAFTRLRVVAKPARPIKNMAAAVSWRICWSIIRDRLPLRIG